MIETAIHCLVDIADIYYVFLADYMNEALLPISLQAMGSSTTAVALQGIEFWTTIAERELELADQAEDAMARGEAPAEQSANYCASQLKELLPVILQLLAQQEEDEDEDEWTVSKAASVCLGILAEVVRDDVVDVSPPPPRPDSGCVYSLNACVCLRACVRLRVCVYFCACGRFAFC